VSGATTAVLVALGAVCAGASVLGVSAWQHDGAVRAAESGARGDAERGRRTIERYGCGSCHTIPGVHGADKLVGPSLERMASRTYVAGVLVNRPDNLVAWIQDPPGIDPLTAMPRLGVTEPEARDIATYLCTLQ
jgi:cytochrome c